MNLVWGFLLGYIVGVLYMCHRSNIDARVDRE
jgi:capsular polysaccharide biosynthesis protein